MILYHGTNQNINSIDLAAGSRFKDFGQGFSTKMVNYMSRALLMCTNCCSRRKECKL